MKIYHNSIPDFFKKNVSLWWLYQLFCLKFVKCSSLRCVFIILVDVLGYTNTANTDLVLFCFILILKWEKQLVLEYIFHCVYHSLFKNSHFSMEASFSMKKNKEIITRKFDFCPTPKKKSFFFFRGGHNLPSSCLNTKFWFMLLLPPLKVPTSIERNIVFLVIQHVKIVLKSTVLIAANEGNLLFGRKVINAKIDKMTHTHLLFGKCEWM